MAVGGVLRQNLKGKLSTTLKSWLPLLQSDIGEIEELVKEWSKENPFISVKSAYQTEFSSFLKGKSSKNSLGDKIEAFTIAQNSLYETLYKQIIPPLFPTQISQDIALDIIEGINNEGYFKDDVKIRAEKLGVEADMYEKIRNRFKKLEPKGVGAIDAKESFLFQLESIYEISDELYDLCIEIIENLESSSNFRKHKLYSEAMKVIKRFNNPPALQFESEETYKIPDIIVEEIDGSLVVRTNDEYYPLVSIESSKIMEKNTKNSEELNYIKTKTKEARDLIDALEMRKSTIKKVGIMIVDYQYDFFMGGEKHPMKLKDIAEELGYAPSTISRAISNKYIECEQGIFPIKSFFTAAIEGDVSNASIKDFLSEIIKNENRKKPLSDLKIMEMIEEKFKLKIVRRTITKYRKQLNIASSSERKKLYEIS